MEAEIWYMKKAIRETISKINDIKDANTVRYIYTMLMNAIASNEEG